MMTTYYLDEESSRQGGIQGIQEKSPPRRQGLGEAAHFPLQRLILISFKQLRRKRVRCLAGKS